MKTKKRHSVRGHTFYILSFQNGVKSDRKITFMPVARISLKLQAFFTPRNAIQGSWEGDFREL